MRNGDCSVRVYWACNTTAATPIPMAERKSSPQSLAGIRVGFDRLPRARLGTVEVKGIGRHLWIAGTLGQGGFARIAELIAKEKDGAGAFFDQITTAAWQHPRADRIPSTLLRRPFSSGARRRPHTPRQPDSS